MSDNTRQPDLVHLTDITNRSASDSASLEFLGPTAVREAAQTIFEAGRRLERERCARILNEFANDSKLFPSQYSPKEYINALVAIAALIRSGE